MRTYVAFIVIISLFMPSTMMAQKNKATLFFKDGTELSGLAKLKGEKKVKIKFRKSKKTKPVVYHFKDLKEVQIFKGEEKETYVYVKIKNKSKPKVLKQLVEGNATLYEKTKEGFSPPPDFANPRGSVLMGMKYSISIYYIKKKEQKEAYHLGSDFFFLKTLGKQL